MAEENQHETRRFVLSFYKKDKYRNAFKEEMICDENTGEVLVKTKSGDVVSYDSSARFKEHLESFTSELNTHGFRGKIYNINNMQPLPHMFKNGEYIIDSSVNIHEDTSTLFISIDADCVLFDKRGDMSKIITNDDIISECTINTYVLGKITKDIRMGILNIININNGDVELHNMTIDKFSVKNIPSRMRLIVHSILIGVYHDSGSNYVEPTSENDYRYYILNNGVHITRYIGKKTSIQIPLTIDGFPVTTLEPTAFTGTDVMSVIIPDSIVEIK